MVLSVPLCLGGKNGSTKPQPLPPRLVPISVNRWLRPFSPMKTHPPALLLAGLTLALLIGGTACRQSRYEHHRILLEKYGAYWNTGNTDGIEAVLHPDYELRYAPDFASKAKGIEGFRKEIAEMRALSFTVAMDEAVYSPDAIALRWTCSATYPDPASGAAKTVREQGLSLIHFKDGKIADEWIAFDRKHWMEQLGFEMKPK
jgi:predicted ester cyclase